MRLHVTSPIVWLVARATPFSRHLTHRMARLAFLPTRRLPRATPRHVDGRDSPLEHCDAHIAEQLLRWHRRNATLLPPTLHNVGEADAGQRLTRIAGRCFESLGSRSRAERAVKREDLLVNSEATYSSRIVVAGDVLSLRQAAPPIPSAQQLASRARFVEHLRSQGMRTMYEDRDVAVVYKPYAVGQPPVGIRIRTCECIARR